jgi:hypothetical protein
MDRVLTLLLGSWTGQLTLPILTFMLIMFVYFIYLFTRMDHTPHHE